MVVFCLLRGFLSLINGSYFLSLGGNNSFLSLIVAMGMSFTNTL